MSSCNTVEIVFAPLPEEERDVDRSAAKELALRMAEKIRNETGASGDGICSRVEIVHLVDWEKDKLIPSSTPSSSNDECEDEDFSKAQNTTVVFLISCGPDGSVHRSVRKLTKWIKEQDKNIKSDVKSKTREENENSHKILPTVSACVVALLGHSVCKTSAEQMEDEVYSSGRRLAKSIQSIISATQSSLSAQTPPNFLLETQIELEPPEEKFDGWVESWVEMLRK